MAAALAALVTDLPNHTRAKRLLRGQRSEDFHANLFAPLYASFVHVCYCVCDDWEGRVEVE